MAVAFLLIGVRSVATFFQGQRSTMSAAISAGLLRPLPFNRTQKVVTAHVSSVRSLLQLPVLQRSRFVVSRAAAADVKQEASTSATGDAAATAGNPAAPTFQEAIFRLQQYWSSKGCVVWLPHNTEVGAGTMNPATFLRVLGPEPWSVCYAEPSVRPDDSRYGENPNRVQRHTQFQVILKPDTSNSQDLYLGSLEALGIDTAAHDVRFVEDNWESPALGAWGLGWEVWLDGMEVTQFTYFQQAGSQTLEVPAVELTYGLERILMALQGVSHFKDIRYSDGVSYGELFMQNEYEMSVYNLDEANVDDLRARFALFEAEAHRMLEKRLPLPAYDHVLKLSHTFNVMDARGAVGFTERQDIFARMRNLAKSVSGLYLERRAELEHPCGLVPAVPVRNPIAAPEPAGEPQPLSAAADFVLEIGSEEIPPAELDSALAQLQAAVPALLERLRLTHAGVRVQGTPRRIAIVVSQLAAAQAAVSEEKRGPPRKRAYDDDGNPTKALLGFCKGCGADPDSVRFEADAKGTEYCYVTVKDAGQPAAAVLAAELPALVKSISFAKSMRWNPLDDVAFSRPMRWLLALHGDTVVPFVYGALASGRRTHVLRNAAQPAVDVASAGGYLAAMHDSGITVDQASRKEAIWNDVVAIAAEIGASVPDSARSDLLEEVTNLVEAPTVIRGSFSEDFLQLPAEVLVMVMRKHQRYFPLYAADGALLNSFVTVANGDVDVDVVRAGNEAVLRARFEDAVFFYNEDLGSKLEDALPKLKGTMFQKELGSLYDKAMRNVELVEPVAAAMGLQAHTATAAAAARLAKADLATAVVTEMTSLAGVMGQHYAQKEGQPQDVADAIFESVLPRSAADKLPRTPAGVVVSVADKADSLVGLAAAGCLPSASADPFGMRRIMYGLLQSLIANDVRVSLRGLVAAAAQLQPIAAGDDVQAAVLEFAGRRLEQLMLDQGVPAEAVRAILAERSDDPTLAVASAQQLKEQLEAGDASPLPLVLQSLSRPTRIIRGKEVDESAVVDEALFDCDEERALWAAYTGAKGALSDDMEIGAFLGVAADLVEPVNAFFESVFVMAEDEAVRRNRLALVRDVARLPAGVLDFAQLPGF